MGVNNFASIQINLASPERILDWSYGEVKKPETINYRSQKPERDGLFCERIFGPTKDWECYCGKYKKVRYKGVICDRCGVEITKSSVRRERMGHINLAAPVAHIWYLRGIPSRVGLLLDVTPKQLEEVVYFVSWIVTDPKDTGLTYKQVLSEKDYRENVALYGPNSFVAQTGAEAVKTLLEEVDLEKEVAELKEEVDNAQGQKKLRLIKRLDCLNSFNLANDLQQEYNEHVAKGGNVTELSQEYGALYSEQIQNGIKQLEHVGVSGEIIMEYSIYDAIAAGFDKVVFITRKELEEEGIETRDVPIGVMVETPAAAVLANDLAKEAAFFSVGTNDLTQYTLAVDRQNAKLDKFYDPYHPALMALLAHIAKAANDNGIWAGICGELGADPKMTEKFIEMGYTELSMAAGRILEARKIVCESEL